jgi:hypothetical protein
MLTVLKTALVITALASFVLAYWTNSRMIKKMRDAGYSYWMINPMSVFAAWGTIEFPIYIVAVLVGVGSVVGLTALQ